MLAPMPWRCRHHARLQAHPPELIWGTAGAQHSTFPYPSWLCSCDLVPEGSQWLHAGVNHWFVQQMNTRSQLKSDLDGQVVVWQLRHLQQAAFWAHWPLPFSSHSLPMGDFAEGCSIVPPY